ncbi:TRAP transporter small permease [Nonomuraea sp. NPDC049649]|uniref:TRAP transporter small permease n=1 Tax=Nonomuraea sp. NPDC049649 TaxID=3155776 RepID=UPI00343BA3D4
MKTVASAYERWVGLALQLISGSAMVVLMIHVVLNVASRRLRNAPVEGTLEWVGNWYLPIIVLAGLVVAQQSNKHVQAELLFHRAPRAIQFEFRIIAFVLSAALALGIGWYGWEHALQNMAIGLSAGVTGVTIWPVTFLVPIAFLLYAVQIVIDATRLVTTGREAPGVLPVNPQEGQPKSVPAGEVV